MGGGNGAPGGGKGPVGGLWGILHCRYQLALIALVEWDVGLGKTMLAGAFGRQGYA